MQFYAFSNHNFQTIYFLWFGLKSFFFFLRNYNFKRTLRNIQYHKLKTHNIKSFLFLAVWYKVVIHLKELIEPIIPVGPLVMDHTSTLGIDPRTLKIFSVQFIKLMRNVWFHSIQLQLLLLCTRKESWFLCWHKLELLPRFRLEEM